MPETADSGGRRRGAAAWKLAEVAVLLPAVFAPLAIGAVHVVPLAIACALSAFAFAAAAWACRRSGEPFELPLPATAFVAALGFVALQLVPLPPSVLGFLSPHTADLFDFVLRPLGLYPAWRPLSLDPPATARELAKGLACTATFLAAVQVARSRRARARLLLALGLLGTLVSLVGLGHMLFGARSLFGLYEFTYASSPLLTTLGNPNHVAALLALSATLLLARIVTERDRRVATLFAFAYLFTGVGVLLTLSRGGIVTFLFAQLLLGVAARRFQAEPGGAPSTAAPLLVPAAALSVLAVAAYLAWDALAREVETVDTAEKLSQSKLALWPTFLPLLRAFPVFGVGKGAFEPAYQRFQEYASTTFTHPENLLFQWAADLGVPMTLALLVALAVALGRTLRRRASHLEPVAAAVALLGLFLHDLGDFSLELAGVALPASVVLGIAVSGDPGPRLPRRVALALSLPLAAALALGLVYGRRSLQREGAALAAKLEKEPASAIDADARAVAARHPADFLPHLVAAEAWALEKPYRPETSFLFAARAMYLSPRHPEPHRLAGRALYAVGRRSQAAIEYRLALELSLGASRDLFEVLARFDPKQDLLDALPANGAYVASALWTLVQRGRSEDAIAAGAEADRRGLATLDVLLAVSSAQDRLGRLDDVAATAKRMEEVAPNRASGLLTRAWLLTRRGDHKAAEALLAAEGLTRFPRDPQVVLALARSRLALGETSGMREALKRLPPTATLGERVEAQRLEAAAAERDGQATRAVSALRTAMVMQPNDLGLRLELARLYERLGRLDEAIAEAHAVAAQGGPAKGAALELEERARGKKQEADRARLMEELERK